MGLFKNGSKLCDFIFLIVIFSGISTVRCQFSECHDDPSPDPSPGDVGDLQFTWMGLLQYIHVKNVTPHYFRVPRVVLISRQFVLSTAMDAAQVPAGYALGNVVFGDYERFKEECGVSLHCRSTSLFVKMSQGNVVFGDYERDEEECGVSIEDLSRGADCNPAVLLMPIADVLLHPEYKHFGATDSVAIMKLITPVKSFYVVPACLPFMDYVVPDTAKKPDKLYHVDFSSDVPRDFIHEGKEVVLLSLLPRELCYLYDNPDNGTLLMKKRKACSTGCNFHSGAPTLVHEHTGHWTLVAISEGGAPCPDPLRPRRPPAPPRHILLFPYVPWITAAITGRAIGGFAKDDPFGYVMPRSDTKSFHDSYHAWNGHWWMGGLRCYDRADAALDMFKFYSEVFQVKPTTKTYMSYYLELFADPSSQVICVKVGMPFRLGQPKVWDLDSPVVKVLIPTTTFKAVYRFTVEAWGYNVSETSTSSADD